MTCLSSKLIRKRLVLKRVTTPLLHSSHLVNQIGELDRCLSKSYSFISMQTLATCASDSVANAFVHATIRDKLANFCVNRCTSSVY